MISNVFLGWLPPKKNILSKGWLYYILLYVIIWRWYFTSPELAPSSSKFSSNSVNGIAMTTMSRWILSMPMGMGWIPVQVTVMTTTRVFTQMQQNPATASMTIAMAASMRGANRLSQSLWSRQHRLWPKASSWCIVWCPTYCRVVLFYDESLSITRWLAVRTTWEWLKSVLS